MKGCLVFLALVIILGLAVFGLGSILYNSHECREDGGEYVRKMNGLYTCMSEKK